MNKELLNEAVELDNHISQLKKHLQEVKDWAKKQYYIRLVSSSAPDSPLLREKYLCITPKVLVSTYISALESEIEELEIKFSNL